MTRIATFLTGLLVLLPAPSAAVASLKDLTLEDASSAFGTLEAEVRLTENATSPVIISLESINGDVLAPATVTVPAGRDRVAFEVTFTSPRTSPDADLGCVVATYNGVKKFFDVELPNEDDTLTPVAFKNGSTTLLTWNEPGKNTSLVYDILRTVSGVQTTVASGLNGCSYVDAATPSGTVTYKVVARSGSGRLFATSSHVPPQMTSPSSLLTLSQPQGAIATPYELVATSSSEPLLEGKLFMNGECVAEANPTNRGTELSFTIDPQVLDNGPQAVTVLAETIDGWVSASLQGTTTSSPISRLKYSELFQPGETGPFALSCNFQAIGAWTVSIVNLDEQVVKTFAGLGTSIDLLWEGLDDQGLPVEEGLYRVRITPPASQQLDLPQEDIPLTIVYSSPQTLGLVTKTSGDLGVDFLYVKFIVQSVWDSLNWSPYCVLMRRDHKMGSFLSRIGPRAERAIRNWLGTSVKRFWVDGHGKQFSDGDLRTVRFGYKRYSSKNTTVVPAESFEQILIDSGRDLSDNPFTFLFFDACYSAGGLESGGVAPVGHSSRTPDNGTKGFPRAFGMDPISTNSDNCFIGVNGLSGNNLTFGWLPFRNDFWGKVAGLVQIYLITFGPPYLHLDPLDYLYFFGDISPFDVNGANTNQRWRTVGGYNNALAY